MMFKRSLLGAALLAVSLSVSAQAKNKHDKFFDVALCNPPLTMDKMTDIYNELEKITKPVPDSTVYIYNLPKEISRDGVNTKQVALLSGMIGVVVQGSAEELAAKFKLEQNKGLQGGYISTLPQAKQPSQLTVASIVLLPYKSGQILACQALPAGDAKALGIVAK